MKIKNERNTPPGKWFEVGKVVISKGKKEILKDYFWTSHPCHNSDKLMIEFESGNVVDPYSKEFDSENPGLIKWAKFEDVFKKRNNNNKKMSERKKYRVVQTDENTFKVEERVFIRKGIDWGTEEWSNVTSFATLDAAKEFVDNKIKQSEFPKVVYEPK